MWLGVWVKEGYNVEIVGVSYSWFVYNIFKLIVLFKKF